MKKIDKEDIKKVRHEIIQGFWKDRIDVVINKALPYQWNALNNEVPGAPKSHAVENFRIASGEKKGEAKGTIFQDSDVAKWIEACSYSLTIQPDEKLEKRIDNLIELIAKSQLPDGYVNTYFIAAVGLEKRWSDLVMGHELYCAGHMIEAAVAYYSATGKRKLLDVMCRFADYIGEVFGPSESQNPGFDGHPEIELALHRLAEITGERKYSDLANYFVDIRGHVANFHVGIAAKDGMIPKSRWFDSDYYLADKPVREMTEPEGHSVRAMYLYCAMADQYRLTGDLSLLAALNRIWEKTVKAHMYITGGLGSQSTGERFTIDYDLPNDTCYTETCASIGLALWAWRMILIEPKGEYGDVMERAMYNGVLSGISLDGTKYFYVNPLDISPKVAQYRQDHSHVETEREPWFDCACCPTNVARFILTVQDYISTISENNLWIHHYADSKIEASKGTSSMQIEMSSNYPWDGASKMTFHGSSSMKWDVRLRIPGWCSSYQVSINGKQINSDSIVLVDGYVSLIKNWEEGDQIFLNLDMPILFIESNPAVRENFGRVAVQRGPIIYCAEECDNGPNLHNYVIKVSGKSEILDDSSLPMGTKAITVSAQDEGDPSFGDLLYRQYTIKDDLELKPFRMIPYFMWGNRKPGQEMRVWFQAKK